MGGPSIACARAKAGWFLSPAKPAWGNPAFLPRRGPRPSKARVSWLEGHTLSFGRTISYWPLLEIIQKDAKIESDDPEAERWAKLASRVGGLFGAERSEILPYLATLLSISLPEDLAQKVRHLDGEAMGRQVYRATRLYFARLAKERPTVVVFEDVHWLDGSSAALLAHLLPLTREVPLLFLFAARPETDSPLTGLRELLVTRIRATA